LSEDLDQLSNRSLIKLSLGESNDDNGNESKVTFKQDKTISKIKSAINPNSKNRSSLQEVDQSELDQLQSQKSQE